MPGASTNATYASGPQIQVARKVARTRPFVTDRRQHRRRLRVVRWIPRCPWLLVLCSAAVVLSGCQSGLDAAFDDLPVNGAPPEPTGQAEPEPGPVNTLPDAGPVSVPDAGGDASTRPVPAPDPVPEEDSGGVTEPEPEADGGPVEQFDECPEDDAKTEPGACGCGVSDRDGDEDGTPDCVDDCPADPDKVEPGACGCGVADSDGDEDGLADCVDACPEDRSKGEPGVCGCDVPDNLLDTDDDGTPDCIDACPNGEVVDDENVCGCGQTDDPTDSDEDGTADCIDLCPSDPDKVEPGVCECGNPELSDDSDGDGTLDCFDACPDDPDKTEPLVCGCGVVEAAEDGDGDDIVDCLDPCPADSEKTEPLVCGCGVIEDTDDPDDDGTPNCLDGCPDDPEKTSPGSCGCGLAESPHCATLRDALVARYGFNQSGAVALDSVGDRNGAVVNTTIGTTGYISLSGGTTDQYVDLPNNLMTGLTNATFEVWFTWTGGDDWQRVFDFGRSDAAEGAQGTGQSYLFLTCAPAPRVGFRVSGQNEIGVIAAAATDQMALNHVTVVFNDATDSLSLYVGGASQGSVSTTHSLSAVTFLNNWLGRSQYSADPAFGGAIGEFRIYDVALSAAQIAASDGFGANPAFLD